MKPSNERNANIETGSNRRAQGILAVVFSDLLGQNFMENKITLTGGYFDGLELDAPTHGNEIRMMMPAGLPHPETAIIYDPTAPRPKQIALYMLMADGKKWAYIGLA
jgi:hypothetical protein